MIRSFLNSFENLFVKLEKARAAKNARMPAALTDGFHAKNVRTHQLAMTPKTQNFKLPFVTQNSLCGTILTGEMFAPILAEQIEKLNSVTGSQLKVIAVPNTYFGGDVSVAGLLTGQDFVAVKDRIEGDFVIIPKQTIKSDEPILLDGMQFEDLKAQFSVPIYNFDLQEFIERILL